MWTKYDEDRLVKIDDGILTIKPVSKPETTPLFCPECSFPMQTREDYLEYQELKCCYKCSIYLAGTNLKAWKEGWRPEKSSQLYVDYMSNRKLTFKPVIRFS